MHSSSCIRKYRDTVEHYVLVLSSGLSIKEGDLELLLSCSASKSSPGCEVKASCSLCSIIYYKIPGFLFFVLCFLKARKIHRGKYLLKEHYSYCKVGRKGKVSLLHAH